MTEARQTAPSNDSTPPDYRMAPDRWRRRLETSHPAWCFAALPPHGWAEDGHEITEAEAAAAIGRRLPTNA